MRARINGRGKQSKERKGKNKRRVDSGETEGKSKRRKELRQRRRRGE